MERLYIVYVFGIVDLIVSLTHKEIDLAKSY